jgi:transposase-like protein
MREKIKCVHCGKSNYVKKGFRQTQNRGKIQRFICRECGRQFTNDGGFYRMRNNEKKITSAIDLYFSNLSSRKL